MSTIAHRLKELRKHLELSQTDFGKKIGKNYHSVMRWELGKVLPPDNVIEHICTTFGINPAWLINGNGGIFKISKDKIIHERENIHYIKDEYITIPVLSCIGDNFPEYGYEDIVGRISVKAASAPMYAIKASSSCASPLMQDDIVVFTTETDNADGKLCVITDRFGITNIRWFFSKENFYFSKRPEYPEIKASEAKIIGVVREVQRKISITA